MYHCKDVPQFRISQLEWMNGCASVGHYGIRKLAKYYGNLTGLEISNCYSVGHSAITHLAERVNRLTAFNISNIGIGDAAVIAIATHCIRLQKPECKNCYNLTDNAIVALARQCTALQHLNCSTIYATHLTLVSVAAISQHCRKLNFIALREIKYCQ